MGKSRRGQKEFSREQKLIKENQSLKQELSRLRKQLARLDLDRYDIVKEVIDEHYQADRKKDAQDLLDKMKEQWKCRGDQCTGYLEIILYNKIDQTWYYRKCTDCANRTLSKRYDSGQVKGIIRKSQT